MDSDYRPPLSKRKCCVPKCTNREGKMHRFPKNEPIVYSEWISKIRPLNYQDLSTEEIYKKYVVCDEHFSSDCKVLGTRRGLKKTAIPTVNLPDEITVGDKDKTVGNDEFAVEIGDIYLDPKPGPSTRYDEDYPILLDKQYEEIGPETPNKSRLETPNRIIPKTPKKGGSILKEINVSRAVQLTPKAKKLYSRVKECCKKMYQMGQKIKSFKGRLCA